MLNGSKKNKRVLINTKADRERLKREAEERRKAFEDNALLIDLWY